MDTSDRRKALRRGAERIAAWADLLDSINVFPVADGDTGRNLALSLTPLKFEHDGVPALTKAVLLSARGNSGNIAARFFSGFLGLLESDSLYDAASRGRDLAYQAVADPKPGSILTFFDSLVQELEPSTDDDVKTVDPAVIVAQLQEVVKDTINQLPQLESAGVVDAGALGMFIFFEEFFNVLHPGQLEPQPILQRFGDLVRLNPQWQAEGEHKFCVDVVLQRNETPPDAIAKLSELDRDVIAIEHDDLLKLHFHTDDGGRIREELAAMAPVVRFSSDDMQLQTELFRGSSEQQSIRIMTDGAGSVTDLDAKRLGMTLLDSYITIGDQSIAESHLQPNELYDEMKQGTAVSTSQASVFERHQHYQKALAMFPRVLYLCVGSFYTGNHETVMAWKEQHDPEDRLLVIDTGTASGKLGLAALTTARFTSQTKDHQEVVEYAKYAIAHCEEYLFLDKLRYLAAGGRLSKSKAFFGDLLHMKPVVSPLPDGAAKAGVVRNREQQLAFATTKATKALSPTEPCTIMLEYSDNLPWLQQEVKPVFAELFPRAEIIVQPLSLTSGAHMGPGTWGIAYLQPSAEFATASRPRE